MGQKPACHSAAILQDTCKYVCISLFYSVTLISTQNHCKENSKLQNHWWTVQTFSVWRVELTINVIRLGFQLCMHTTYVKDVTALVPVKVSVTGQLAARRSSLGFRRRCLPPQTPLRWWVWRGGFQSLSFGMVLVNSVVRSCGQTADGKGEVRRDQVRRCCTQLRSTAGITMDHGRYCQVSSNHVCI